MVVLVHSNVLISVQFNSVRFDRDMNLNSEKKHKKIEPVL